MYAIFVEDDYISHDTKSGDLSDDMSYRSISILHAIYKFFARMLYHILESIFDKSRRADQIGLRRHIRIEAGLVVLESLYSRCVEFNLPLCIASIDLHKACDRILYGISCQALEDHNVDQSLHSPFEVVV